MSTNVAYNSAELLRLHGAVDGMRRRRAIVERDSSPRYNVFQFLGVERYEAWLHSPFLRDLLDPYGDHGQGAVFLREFVGCVSTWFGWPCPQIDDWPPPGEWVVQTEVRKIDISLRSSRHGWLLFVENKIAAVFQADQMRGYKQILELQKREYQIPRPGPP